MNKHFDNHSNDIRSENAAAKEASPESSPSENKMDDLQFRRSIYANPKSQDSEILAAQQADPAKHKLAQELCLFDEQLKQAMQIPVPDDLAHKLLLRQTLTSHQQHKRKSRIHLALAASVTIIAGIVISYLQFSSSYNNMGDYALAHVYHEQHVFSNEDTNRVDLNALNKKMTTFNGRFTNTMGELISADYCRFDGMKSLHLVFQGLTDTVAVFVVPKKEHLAFTDTFSDAKLQGESLAFKEANILIVADKNESLTKWQRIINDNIAWSS
mgnify:CR=1 FL=1